MTLNCDEIDLKLMKLKKLLLTFLFISAWLYGTAYSKNITINGKNAQEIIAGGEILSLNYKESGEDKHYHLLIKRKKSVYICQVSKKKGYGASLYLNTVCYRDD